MFKKKSCANCGEKITGKENFCPECGKRLQQEENAGWGMLGKDDLDTFGEDLQLPVGFGTIFNSLAKTLDKQFKELGRNLPEGFNPPNTRNSGISINISTSGNKPPKIRINQFGTPQKKDSIKRERVPVREFDSEQIKKLSALPRKEPVTEMKRFENKIIYELKMPEVKSREDISIIQLENSIEIKAIGERHIYKKILPVNLPIKKYNLEKGILILELGIGN